MLAEADSKEQYPAALAASEMVAGGIAAVLLMVNEPYTSHLQHRWVLTIVRRAASGRSYSHQRRNSSPGSSVPTGIMSRHSCKADRRLTRTSGEPTAIVGSWYG